MKTGSSKNDYFSATFKLPKTLNQTMDERIIRDGYGMRGKSKWIKEAIQGFLELPNCVELVGLSDELESPSSSSSVRISRDLLLQIEEAVKDVRGSFPLIEGVKSKIIRASIYQRLLNNTHISGHQKST